MPYYTLSGSPSDPGASFTLSSQITISVGSTVIFTTVVGGAFNIDIVDVFTPVVQSAIGFNLAVGVAFEVACQTNHYMLEGSLDYNFLKQATPGIWLHCPGSTSFTPVELITQAPTIETILATDIATTWVSVGYTTPTVPTEGAVTRLTPIDGVWTPTTNTPLGRGSPAYAIATTPGSSPGTPLLECRDFNDNLVLVVGAAPNANGDYLIVNQSAFTASDAESVPSGQALQLFISAATALQFVGETLTYLLRFTPASGGWAIGGVQQPIPVLSGELRFLRTPSTPQLYVT